MVCALLIQTWHDPVHMLDSGYCLAPYGCYSWTRSQMHKALLKFLGEWMASPGIPHLAMEAGAPVTGLGVAPARTCVGPGHWVGLLLGP